MTEKRVKTYQLKISLLNARPPIWRRLLVAGSTPLSVMHDLIQIAMGWTNSHLHHFIAHEQFYGVPDPDFGWDEVLDESRYKLSQLLKREKDSLIYEYDFGDSWRHKITLEKILLTGPETRLPGCLKGKGSCPPEDVGGVWGYQHFLEAISDPQHPEHGEMLEWVGGPFDPADFDLEETNRLLFQHAVLKPA